MFAAQNGYLEAMELLMNSGAMIGTQAGVSESVFVRNEEGDNIWRLQIPSAHARASISPVCKVPV